APKNPTYVQELAMQLSRLGQILTKLEKYAAAHSALTESLAQINSALAADPTNSNFQYSRYYTLANLTQLAYREKSLADPLKYAQEALDTIENLARQQPANRQLAQEFENWSQTTNSLMTRLRRP